MDIIQQTQGTRVSSPYDEMMQAAAAEAAAKAEKEYKSMKKYTRGSQSGFRPASRAVMTPHLAEFGNRRLPLSSLKPEFVPSPSPIDGQGQPTLPDMLIEPTIDEQVELFAPLATTDWKKYWPLAAAGVGAIAVVMLMRKSKAKSNPWDLGGMEYELVKLRQGQIKKDYKEAQGGGDLQKYALPIAAVLGVGAIVYSSRKKG